MTPLTRFKDWRTRMALYHEVAKAAKFSWSSFDCAKYASGHVNAITGVDLGSTLATYTDGPSATKAIEAAGYTSLLDICQKNFPAVEKHLAQRGDIGAIETDDTVGVGFALAVCHGDKWSVMTPKGLGFIPLTSKLVKYGFKIG